MSRLTKVKKTNQQIWLPSIALFIVAAIVPIIVRHTAVNLPPEIAVIFREQQMGDMFSYHKSWVIILCAAALLFHAASELLLKFPESYELKGKLKTFFRNPVIAITSIYLFFVIISNIFSPYTHTALFGLYDRREGLFIQMAYITIFLSTIAYVKDRENTNILLIGLLCSSIVMGLIGFSQFINRDFFATHFAAWLTTGIRYYQPPGSDEMVRFSMTPGFTMAYGTNFNPNTFGKITAMLTPLLFAAAFISRKLVLRILFLIAGALMFIGIVASRSVGGFIGGASAIAIIIVVLLLQKGLFNRKTFIILGIAAVIALSSGFVLRNYIYENLSFTLGRITAIFEAPSQDHLPQFEFNENRLTMTDRGHTYHISFPEGGGTPTLTTADGTEILPNIDPDTTPQMYHYTFAVPDFRNVRIMRFNDVYVYRDIRMALIDGHLNLIYHTVSLVNPNDPIPSFGFEGWETWGSNRGFIFARTIPLLPQSLIIGSGSDTFITRFPQHDVISKARYFNNPNITVDKAHNLYLQTAITTGLISALALIALFGYYIISTLLILIRKTSQDFWLRLGILAAVVAYSVASLATDSTVSSAPMFWIILGMGFALNKLEAAK